MAAVHPDGAYFLVFVRITIKPLSEGEGVTGVIQTELRYLVGRAIHQPDFFRCQVEGIDAPFMLAGHNPVLRSGIRAAGQRHSAKHNNTDEERERPPVAGESWHHPFHTCNSIIPEAGAQPKIVSERLGHATVAFTLDTYGHVVPGLQEAAAKRFDEVLVRDSVTQLQVS